MLSTKEPNIIKHTLYLAENLQKRVNKHISTAEKTFHHKMQKLLSNPSNKVMLIELLDKSFRCKDRARSFEIISHTLETYGIADFFSPFERVLLQIFLGFGRFMPRFSVPFFVREIRNQTKAMVLNDKDLHRHIAKRLQSHITLNVNVIGEEVLGEGEASRRIEKYKQAILSPHISYISIKITTIFSQINIIDFEYSKNEIIRILNSLYALAFETQQEKGIKTFINLDMEEFRDLELTISAFVDSIAKFPALEAGIVLQAYIPDSFSYLKKLFAFSKKRVQNGGVPIKIRFVKGANMESEETIASQKGYNLPTFKEKIHTDSNYNKMLHFILESNRYEYIKIGIASHNIFQIAYALTIIQYKQQEINKTRKNQKNQPNAKSVLESFSFEMLEGMSLQTSFELSKLAKLILYAPVCDKKHFNNAIAYLVRRLDENTSEENFMRHFFNLHVHSKEWKKQKDIFLQAINGIDSLNNRPRRVQDKGADIDINDISKSSFVTNIFTNEQDTDFVLSTNRAFAQKIKQQYEFLNDLEIYPIAKQRLDEMYCNPPKILKEKINDKRIGVVYNANAKGIEHALQIALHSTFSNEDSEKIYEILAKFAQILRAKRGELIGIAALEVGKPYTEIDAEISEAIDFVEFYPYSLRYLKSKHKTASFAPKGVGVVIAPWNFPIGISAGTIAAPLAAGNRVIYKPSSLSVATGYKLCECFYEAGIPKDALIFLPANGNDVSSFLLNHKDIAFSVLTGGEETAYNMLKANPALELSAETGGKNATIVSAMSDREQAIKNVIHSAFSNSGQKCSATSLLILEKAVYDDKSFKESLIDAANSLNVGSPFNLYNKLGTLADKPNKVLQKALENLESGEDWALEPSFVNDNPFLMRPSIKYGVKRGAYTHKTELFAPLLSVMCAKDLKEAIEIANETGYGLTSALESLDEREWAYFATHIEAGNMYINKPTTGAIVLRQPFGGIKKSAIGYGRKVGIFNYITQFLTIKASLEHIKQNINNPRLKAIQNALNALSKNANMSTTQRKILKSSLELVKNYAYYEANEFRTKRDFVHIRGEENWFYYEAIKSLGFFIGENDSLDDMLAVIIGALIAGVRLFVSVYENKHIEILKALNQSLDFSLNIEHKEAFCKKIHQFERVRYLATPSVEDKLYIESSKQAKIIIRHKPILNGYFELLYYYNEKSLSIAFHRYGNLGARGLKTRKDLIKNLDSKRLTKDSTKIAIKDSAHSQNPSKNAQKQRKMTKTKNDKQTLKG